MQTTDIVIDFTTGLSESWRGPGRLPSTFS